MTPGPFSAGVAEMTARSPSSTSNRFVGLSVMASIAALDAAGRLLALALYRFATTDALVGGFTSAELSSALKRKRGWRPWRR